ncbi:MAG: efflux RND transporter periplasmic adaptor subunit [Candidatus Eremiobacteraeota bacterium]|nr:efflux RND transporter periplasmic adaptor subunit [Candidatus Eremiobacteraeota bacterium]
MKVRAFAIIAIVTLGTAACGGGAKKQQGPPPLAVDVTKAHRQDISTSITLDGQVVPLYQSTLSTPESGTVSQVLVNEGDRVTKGQLLAQLDASQLVAQLAANQATADQSEAKLRGSNVQAPISSQQYSSAVYQARQTLQAAQNTVRVDEAALRNAQLVYDSNQQLVKQGYVSKTAAEQANASYVSAQQALASARQAVPAAQAALNTALKNTQQTQVDQTTIQQNKAELEQARANVKLLQVQIAQSSIYAPFDGTVTQRLLDPGAYAGPNQAIVQVSHIDQVYINANVPDESLAYVQANTPVRFTSQSVPGHVFTGRIFDVNATPTSGTLSYRARVRYENGGDVLRGGMLVSLIVQKERHPDAIVVPRTAVFQSDQGANVYTVGDDNKAKMIPVQIGLETDTLAEVKSADVHPGTVVITTRPDALQDGSVVAVSGSAPHGAAPGASH